MNALRRVPASVTAGRPRGRRRRTSAPRRRRAAAAPRPRASRPCRARRRRPPGRPWPSRATRPRRSRTRSGPPSSRRPRAMAARAIAGTRPSVLAAMPAMRSRRPALRVCAGAGNGFGSSPWTWTARQRRCSAPLPATPRAGGEVGRPSRRSSPAACHQRHVGDEPDAVALRPRGRRAADLQHLEVDRAGARDAARHVADELLDLRQHGRTGAARQLGQRLLRLTAPDDQVVEPQAHASLSHHAGVVGRMRHAHAPPHAAVRGRGSSACPCSATA